MMTEDEVPSVNPKLDAMCEMLKIIHDLNERNKTLEERGNSSCIGCKYEAEQRDARFDSTGGCDPFHNLLIGPINAPNCNGCKRSYYYLRRQYSEHRPEREVVDELKNQLKDRYQKEA